MVSEAVGVLVAVVIQGQLVSKTRKTEDCGSKDKMSDKQLDDEVQVYDTFSSRPDWD